MADGRRIDLVYRRVLVNDVVARARRCARAGPGDRGAAACVANTFRCKIPHKKSFFALLTDEP